LSPVTTDLGAVVDAVRDGLIVGIPTDTVYGIAADPFRSDASSSLALAKGRAADVPLQVLVSGFEQASSIGIFAGGALAVAKAFWPGALTLVVPRSLDADLSLGGETSTVGIRWPSHEFVVSLCAECGPVAATSANRHGESPIQTAAEVAAAFGEAVAVVFDGGTCPGIASTVVDLSGDEPVILREGAVSKKAVEKAFFGTT
jgi:tRNA threonylcarbamoyl adenosine modification protein (Sua5/YciO/YrdC/YwlC family)